MMYRVIREFTDLQHDNFMYRVGDTFPAYPVSEDRIAELASSKNKRGLPLIEKEPSEEEKPKKKGKRNGKNTKSSKD